MIATETRPGARLPGPRHVPVIGWQIQGLKMLRDPPAHFTEAFRRYGPVSAWDPRKPRHVYALGPDYNKLLFTQPERFIVDAFRESNLPRDSSMERLTFGLLRLNGDAHRKHRTLMQPAFRVQRIEACRETIIASTQHELDSWRVGERRRIDLDLMRLIVRVAMQTMFGLDSLDGTGVRLHSLIQRLLTLAAAPTTMLLRLNLPGTPYRQMLRVAQEIEQILAGLIRRKRQEPGEGLDVLSALVSARDENGNALTDNELIGEAYNVLCHSTSAASMTWTLFLLDQHPEVMNTLVDELRTTLGGAPPTLEQLKKLEYLDLVLKESLRLFPPASFLMRYASESCQLGPYEIPEGAMVFASGFVTHRLPELFPRPLKFDPLRWKSTNPTVYEYMPFGAGPHNCLGRHMAMLEMKLILSMVLQRFRPSLVSGTSVNRAMRISLVPREGLPVVIHPAGTSLARPVARGNIHESIELN
ncbi:cytochrome P450 [Myxococcus sp. AM009]|uniref:cytochrome P450 n=1 Tax=Myxococcus sp. AM009 TaxID=2745137 RepID=UPI0015960763|nr:cytochrome P450 [Myxococcus sp. AM009]NVI98242.1 cytochrome P450 [Myxococcus sp. AM009]